MTVDVVPGQIQSASTVPTGGVAFSPLTPGTTNVAANAPGYLTTTAANVTVTVN